MAYSINSCHSLIYICNCVNDAMLKHAQVGNHGDPGIRISRTFSYDRKWKKFQFSQTAKQASRSLYGKS